MNEQLDAELCRKYPVLFRDRGARPPQTGMVWGFECGDGWFDILDTLCYFLQEVCHEHARKIIVEQVKEKYGSLRFYWRWEWSSETGDIGVFPDVLNHHVDALVNMAEALTHYICEMCGATARLRGKTWVVTLCDAHWRTYQRDRGLTSRD